MSKYDEDYEEEYEDEEDYSDAIKIIIGHLFMCVEDLKYAGYSSKDFEDILEY